MVLSSTICLSTCSREVAVVMLSLSSFCLVFHFTAASVLMILKINLMCNLVSFHHSIVSMSLCGRVFWYSQPFFSAAIVFCDWRIETLSFHIPSFFVPFFTRKRTIVLWSDQEKGIISVAALHLLILSLISHLSRAAHMLLFLALKERSIFPFFVVLTNPCL
jgi:hypothetical protein